MSDTQTTTHDHTVAAVTSTGDVTVIAQARHIDATTVEQVDPRTLLIETNVRTSADLDPEFIASVRDLGVLTPVLVHRTSDGLRVRAGQRRTLAAIEAGRETIPALVLNGDDDQVQRIVEQWSENHHRRALSTADDAAAFEQLALLGLSAAQIAKRTRAKKTHVTTALAVSASTLATRAAAKYDLTLDQAAVIAEFEDDEETVKALTVAAVKEPGKFAHIAQRARDERARAAERAAFTDDLTAQGFTVLTEPVPPFMALWNLTDEDGTALAEETHAACLGRAALVRTRWDGTAYVSDYGCTDPAAHGHRERVATAATTPALSPAEQAEQDETRKAAKRLVIENNRAWRSAETVRREWLATFAQRKSAPKDAATFIATALVRHTSPDGDALAVARTWLNLATYQWGQPDPLNDLIAKATPARAQHIALVLILATIEQATGVHTWRHPDASKRAYFTALATWGYPLSDVESILTADPDTSDQADPGDLDDADEDDPGA